MNIEEVREAHNIDHFSLTKYDFAYVMLPEYVLTGSLHLSD